LTVSPTTVGVAAAASRRRNRYAPVRPAPVADVNRSVYAPLAGSRTMPPTSGNSPPEKMALPDGSRVETSNPTPPDTGPFSPSK
jgi:hypothetical protein